MATAEPMADQGAKRPRFADRPALVFWETTTACLLACRHCRASAQASPLPGELDPAEGMALLERVAAFGAPRPVVVFTGGDVMMRSDLFALLEKARSLGLVTAVSPSATHRLDADALNRLASLGVHGLSISIDAMGDRHDRLRGVPGTFERSVRALAAASAAGLKVQVNTVVMRSTVEDLADIVAMLVDNDVRTWEVFFLVATGRALASEYLAPGDIRDVLNFLLETTRHGIELRVVEGPFVQRALRDREASGDFSHGGPLYARLRERLRSRIGEPTGAVRLSRGGTLDGDGIVFVAHDGAIHPGGLLPLRLGNVREDDLVAVYRHHPALRAIRARAFDGACGRCDARQICGGSRARAFASTADPLSSDPLCPWA